MTKIERLFPKERKIDICQLQEFGKLFNPPKKAFAIPVNIGSKIVFVQCSIITYCVAKDGYVSLITDEGKEYVCNLTLKQLEERLPDDFIRVQKSYIVHKEKIQSLSGAQILTEKQNAAQEEKTMAYMSEEGYQKLVAELKHLESVERPKIVAAIAEARDKGDLSENAEYDAAKEAQGMLEMKINQLKATIGDAKIIDTSKLKADTVQILTRVELKNVKTGMKMAYTIVSETEANLKLGKISVNTPIAQGLLGKKVGDIAEITIPQGKISLEVTGISF